MKTLPGRDAVEGLASLKKQIADGEIVLPIRITLERGGEKIVIPFENLADIDILGNGDSVAKVSFLVKSEEPWTIKVSKDGKGKPVFLKNLE